MADLFLVTDFSFDSYVYLCLFSLQLIVVQIQIDSAYFLKTEIAVFRFGLWTQIYFIEKYFYLLKVSVYHWCCIFIYLISYFLFSLLFDLFCLVFDPKLGRFLLWTGQRTCFQNTEDPEGLTSFTSPVSPAEYESALTCPGFTIFFPFRAFFWHETSVTRLCAVTLPIINRMNACHWSQRLQLILLLSLPLLSPSTLTFQGVTNQLHCISTRCWRHSGLQNHENFEGP